MRAQAASCSGCVGFTMPEVLLAVLVAALLVAPVLAFIRGAGALRHETSERGRHQALSELRRQLLSQGIDTAASPGVQCRGIGKALSAVGTQRERTTGPGAGVGLLTCAAPVVGEAALAGGAGFELTTSANAEVGGPATAPISEMSYDPPAVNPVSGSLLQPALFRGPSLQVTALGVDGGLVVLELSRPVLRVEGKGRAGCVVSAEDIVAGLSGSAWVEYPGKESLTEECIPLEDGRRAWLVREGSAWVRRQPSSRVSLSYALNLGAPLLRFGSAVHTSGAAVSVDYRSLLSVRSRATPVALEWPAAVRSLFPPQGAVPGLACSFSFQGAQMDASSWVDLVFGEVSRWGAASRLVVRAQAGAHCLFAPGQWTLVRVPLVLPVPEREVSVSISEAGLQRFRTSELAEIGRVGRLSARGGTVLGLGTTLDLEVSP